MKHQHSSSTLQVHSLKLSSNTNAGRLQGGNSCERGQAAGPLHEHRRHCRRYSAMSGFWFLCMAALFLQSWHPDSKEILVLAFINGRIPLTHKSDTSKISIPCGSEVIQLISRTGWLCVCVCVSLLDFWHFYDGFSIVAH